mmetsp:Transcript_102981/g.297808  ORF Transcript_102981/g.297808 Transcript_102981/m.297808 type:complete len:92 (+) Transcript_102981:612-887(+)
MHDAGQSTSKEWHLVSFATVHTTLRRSSKCRHRHGSMHDRKIDAGLFPDFSIGKDSRVTAAASVTNPAVLAKLGSTINLFDSICNTELSFA